MSLPTFSQNDLVFTVSGGPRDGEYLPVTTRKCVLAFDEESSAPVNPSAKEKSRIAIFRGAAGVTVRNYGDDILVNGESKATHWLVNGDKIQFPSSVTLNVLQLGTVEGEAAGTAPATVADSSGSEAPAGVPPVKSHQKFSNLESQVSEIKQQNDQVQGRFNELDQRLSQLTDQLSKLVTIATNAPGTAPESEPEPQSQPEFSAEPDSPSESFSSVLRSAETVVDSAPVLSQVRDRQDSETIVPQDREEESQVRDRVADPQSSPASPPRQQDASLAAEWAKIESSSLGNGEAITSASGPVEAFADRVAEPVVAAIENQLQEEVPVSEPQANVSQDSALQDSALQEIASQDSTLSTALSSEAPEAESQEADISSYGIKGTEEPVGSAQVEEMEMEGVEEAENIEATLDVNERDESEEPAVPDQAPESVSDLLARMKSEGQWGGVEDDDPPAGATPEPVPEPVSPIQQSQPEPQKAGVPEESDVQDYMSQLLTRMRGGDEAAPVPVKAETVPEPEEVSVEPVKRAAAEPVELIKAEEYVPQQKATRIESLGAMRELANSTARTAVADSEEDRRKALAYVQLAIAMGSLVMAAYYFLFMCGAIGDVHSIIGSFCLGLSAFLGFRGSKILRTPAEKPSPV